MPRIRMLSDVYVRPEPILRETTVYLKLHILASQMERLNYSKESNLQKVDQINKRLANLQYQCNKLKELL